MDRKWYIRSAVVRLVFLCYGCWQDAVMTVKYTDIDYYVFSDAARFVTEGLSPFLRPTYRYTPLLAWILTPNVWISSIFGKLVFILSDLLVGHLLYQILHKMGHSEVKCLYSALMWLFNPLCVTVSSRGNAESLIACLVLMTFFLLLQEKIAASALFYALSVHFKIYPLTFAFPLYLYLGLTGDEAKASSYKMNTDTGKKGQGPKQSNFVQFLMSLAPNRKRLVFISSASTVLGILTIFFYWMYGWQFLFETYLYHIVRGDIRHNFSPYFYLLYLTSNPEFGVPLCLRLLVFLPQALLLLALAFKFYHHLELCWFLSVFVFVAFNKVCTSQYFLWYLSLVPLVVPDLNLKLPGLITLLVLWLGSQAIWLLPAYLLEFQGQNTFLLLWLSSLLFLGVNAFIVYKVIITHHPNNPNRPRKHIL